MPHIAKRTLKNGKLSFRAELAIAGFPRQRKTFGKRSQALAWAQRTEIDMREGQFSKAEKAKLHSVTEMIDRYIATVLQTKTDRERYRQNQHMQLLWWKQQLGDYELSKLRASSIAEARDKLLTYGRRRRKPATINRYLAAFSHVLSIAYKEWEWLPENPIATVKKMKEPRGRVRFLSEKERLKLLAACKKETTKPLYEIVTLAIATGPRKNEALSVKIHDIDLKRGSIVLEHTKNGERRSLHLSPFIVKMLREYISTSRIVDGFLFPAVGKKLPVNIDYEFRAAVKAAGIKDFRFHDLRHTAASYLAMNGASLVEIAEFLGHKTLNMVKRYAHLLKAHSAGVVTRMNDQIFTDADDLKESQHEA